MLTFALPTSRADLHRARQDRMSQAMASAWRSPFCRARLRAAGLSDGEVPDAAAWLRIRPTSMDDLRAMPSDELREQTVIADRSDVATYWYAPGQPLPYPRAHRDWPAVQDAFVRVLAVAGIEPGWLVQNAFPLGLGPIGQMMGHALRAHGCGVLSTGSSANTPTEIQLRAMFDLGPECWIGHPSFLVQLGHMAAALRVDPRSAGLRQILGVGERLSTLKRRRIEQVWGAPVCEAYGMAECSLMGAECERHRGFHLWSDLFLVELLDPESWQPVRQGDPGMVVVTPLHNESALPLLRWVSGDVARLEDGCDCARGYSVFPRLRLVDRAAGTFRVRGVTIAHADLEELLLGLEGVADYLCTVSGPDPRDELLVEVESGHAGGRLLAATVDTAIQERFGVGALVEVLPRGTIARRLETAGQYARFREIRTRRPGG